MPVPTPLENIQLFWRFIVAVCRHYFLVGGGAIIGTILVLCPEIYQGVRVSGWWLVVALLFAGTFAAWKEQHLDAQQEAAKAKQDHDALTRETEQLRAHAKSKQKREEIRAKLGGFQLDIEDRVRDLKNMKPEEVVTFGNNLNATKINDDFINEILEYVMKNVGASYGAEFLMDAGLPDRTLVLGHNLKYQQHLYYLRCRAFRLKQIIEQYRID
jgi:FtsZ-binding cell division protein ZapB